jgi:hypothetical protein
MAVAFQGLIVFCAEVEVSATFYEGLLGFRRELAGRTSSRGAFGTRRSRIRTATWST